MSIGGFFGKIIGSGVTEVVTGVADVVDRFMETPEEKTAAKLITAKMKQDPHKWQVELNKISAAHRSIFVAGWRPYLGWVLGTSLAFYYLPQFAMASVLWVRVCWETQTLAPYPITDIAGLTQLVLGMLGLAGLRTYEKKAGLTK
jgi:hypothetical protein